MGKMRRGGYVFVSWAGDHTPRHVHVYQNGALVLEWDLDEGQAMEGRAVRRVLQLIRQLGAEGLL